MQTMLFAEPGSPWPIDSASLVNGQWVSELQQESLQQLRLRYPNAQLYERHEWIAAAEKALIRPPRRISEREFDDQLTILPPVNWVRTANTDSFQISERITGRIVHIYARYLGQHFHLVDRSTLTHAEIIAKCHRCQRDNPKSTVGA